MELIEELKADPAWPVALLAILDSIVLKRELSCLKSVLMVHTVLKAHPSQHLAVPASIARPSLISRFPVLRASTVQGRVSTCTSALMAHTVRLNRQAPLSALQGHSEQELQKTIMFLLPVKVAVEVSTHLKRQGLVSALTVPQGMSA